MFYDENDNVVSDASMFSRQFQKDLRAYDDTGVQYQLRTLRYNVVFFGQHTLIQLIRNARETLTPIRIDRTCEFFEHYKASQRDARAFMMRRLHSSHRFYKDVMRDLDDERAMFDNE